ncbi:tRNA (adenosine(37)-N6)-threonylcarbamoyltransferase complex ATPase subunit type 1 TsaE [Spirochaeta dissipatitropha]
MQIESPTSSYTEKIGAALSRSLTGGSIIRVVGGLGLGKTVLAHGAAIGLGISEPITSPTYTIVQEYKGEGGLPGLIHVDLYRINSEEELDELGLIEMISDPDYIMLIEWADRVPETIFPAAITVHMAFGDSKDTRLITISPEPQSFTQNLKQEKKADS